MTGDEERLRREVARGAGADRILALLDVVLAKGGESTETQSLRQLVRDLLEALLWMSGSSDFAPEGAAHEGWRRVRDGVVRRAQQAIGGLGSRASTELVLRVVSRPGTEMAGFMLGILDCCDDHDLLAHAGLQRGLVRMNGRVVRVRFTDLDPSRDKAGIVDSVINEFEGEVQEVGWE